MEYDCWIDPSYTAFQLSEDGLTLANSCLNKYLISAFNHQPAD